MFLYPKHFDVLVIGGGHAGCEAAFAAARLGCTVGILTQNLDTIAQMSCNPAIGGVAKGHIVREIDAIGGAMALNADATGIQFRTLNAGRGPSVRAPRVQCDKKAYQFRMKYLLESDPQIELVQGNAKTLLVKEDRIQGVETTFGVCLNAKSLIITTGTFMRGLLHVGKEQQKGGRMGDSASGLSASFAELGIQVQRFKTGTPCRINGRSINFSKCQRQDGDVPPEPLSLMPEQLKRRREEIFSLNYFENGLFHVEQLPCWITYTNEQTHTIIRNNLDQSPLYCGLIEGIGPRYCPSIEDKVVKFSHKPQHQIFLEPEGLHTREYYVNGLSTSLPYEVQLAFIHSIPGLENAEIIRPGYAVEYDYCPPTQLCQTLESKKIENLYFAGQVNGTSGYEEAAAQGLIAGANAALKLQGKKAFLPGRAEAYIGVLVDDLVTKGVCEPYRMFTSRAEHRLLLRQDNADLRLSPAAFEAGLIPPSRMEAVREKLAHLDSALQTLNEVKLDGVPALKCLKRTEVSYKNLPENLLKSYPEAIWRQIEIDIKYEGYIRREQEAVNRMQKQEARSIPSEIDFCQLKGIKPEAQMRLEEIRPKTLGQASRISGVTPADISLLAFHVEHFERTRQKTQSESTQHLPES